MTSVGAWVRLELESVQWGDAFTVHRGIGKYLLPKNIWELLQFQATEMFLHQNVVEFNQKPASKTLAGSHWK